MVDKIYSCEWCFFFFIFVYQHIGRGLYYGSYRSPRAQQWCLGVIIFIIMIGTAFLGYVLPWGQMSYWAATVITNQQSAIPWVGNDQVKVIWGVFQQTMQLRIDFLVYIISYLLYRQHRFVCIYQHSIKMHLIILQVLIQ